MLNLFRRHLKRCTHRAKSRSTGLHVPAHGRGPLRGVMIGSARHPFVGRRPGARPSGRRPASEPRPTSANVVSLHEGRPRRNARPARLKNLPDPHDLERTAERKGLQL